MYRILRLLTFSQISRDSSNKRETSVAVGAQKSTLWENMKSFATGILNIWKKSWRFMKVYGATFKNLNVTLHHKQMVCIWFMMFLALFGLPLAGMFLQILFSCYPSTFPERFCCQVSSMIQLAAHFKCKAFAHEFLAPLFHWPHLGGNQYFNSQSSKLASHCKWVSLCCEQKETKCMILQFTPLLKLCLWIVCSYMNLRSRVEGWKGAKDGEAFAFLDSIRRITNLRMIGFQRLQFFLMHNKTQKLRKLVGFLKLYFLLPSLNILITLHPNYVLNFVLTCKALALSTNCCSPLFELLWYLAKPMSRL